MLSPVCTSCSEWGNETCDYIKQMNIYNLCDHRIAFLTKCAVGTLKRRLHFCYYVYKGSGYGTMYASQYWGMIELPLHYLRLLHLLR